MGVEKLSISLPEELVASLDAIADTEGLTRSGLIRELAADYVTRRASGERERLRRERVDAAIAGFESIAEEWGHDERTASEVLAEMRAAEEEVDG